MLTRFLSINSASTSPVRFASFAAALGDGKSGVKKETSENIMIFVEIIATVLVADFVSGLVHWLEDAYGHEDWPIIGRLVTQPNILHHHNPRYFVKHSWLRSSWLLLCLGLLALGTSA